MPINEVIDFIKQRATDFGAKTDGPLKSYVFRNNAKDGPSDQNRAYFGFIQPDEEPSGTYHDFSFVIFPGADHNKWIVEVGVGSSGFKNDYELATFPGLRRLFSKLINENGFCKSDFSDIETSLPESFSKRDDLIHLANTVKYYSKFFSMCQVIDDPENDEGKAVISSILAAYADMRSWPTNERHRKAVDEALKSRVKSEVTDPVKEVRTLLDERRFVVVQGAPGTGKTRTAKIIAGEIGGNVFFTQFHAETSYSDFIYGIRPNIDGGGLNYSEQRGILTNAIQHAIDNPQEKTVLIIDEINRANLSNVLGPVFYLFEHKLDASDIQIEISPGLSLKALPDNFLVLATMNTADRSLAVVDFALRRRFAWYTLHPTSINEESFHQDDFDAIDKIFNWYASSAELSLQPGQGYFIAANDEEMRNRIRYELFPLIREYLQEGLVRSAKEAFNSYFLKRINKSLFE